MPRSAPAAQVAPVTDRMRDADARYRLARGLVCLALISATVALLLRLVSAL